MLPSCGARLPRANPRGGSPRQEGNPGPASKQEPRACTPQTVLLPTSHTAHLWPSWSHARCFRVTLQLHGPGACGEVAGPSVGAGGELSPRHVPPPSLDHEPPGQRCPQRLRREPLLILAACGDLADDRSATALGRLLGRIWVPAGEHLAAIQRPLRGPWPQSEARRRHAKGGDPDPQWGPRRLAAGETGGQLCSTHTVGQRLLRHLHPARVGQHGLTGTQRRTVRAPRASEWHGV